MNDDQEVPRDFDGNEYSRPNAAWRCGHADLGAPCPLGPSPDGRCGAICRPYVDQASGRYLCANDSPRSGQCDDGPLDDGSCCFTPALCAPEKKTVGGRTTYRCGRIPCPGPTTDGECCGHFPPCRPIRGVLARRRMFSLCAATVALGSVLLAVAGPWRTAAVKPGGLTARHSALTNRCGDCHTVGDGGLDDWLHHALSAGAGVSQDDLCLKCHQQFFDHSSLAHNLPTDALARFTDRSTETDKPLSLRLAGSAGGIPDRLTCSTCHREHHGADFDLERMADSRCQSCHQNAFHDFVDGHPEFAHDYLYRRRTRIYFDHRSHYLAHFKDRARLSAKALASADQALLKDEIGQQSCRSCHVPDAQGSKMLVKPFGQACAACHLDQIDQSGEAGGGRLVIADSLNETGPERIGASDWMSPLLSCLLSDQELSAARASEQDDETVTDVVQSIGGNRAGVVRRLSLRLREHGIDATDEQLRWLSELIPVPEVADIGQESSEDPSEVRRADVSRRYRPVGHADPRLKTWLDVTVRFAGEREATGGGNTNPFAEAFRMLSHASAPGSCMKCHTVETSSVPWTINWQPYQPDTASRSFTRFSHQPHLVMLTGQACTECHEMKTADEGEGARIWNRFRPQFLDDRWWPVTSAVVADPDFRALSKSDCVTCHRPQRASPGCTTCHNYHVNDLGH